MSKRLLFVKGDILESQVLKEELSSLNAAWTLDFVASGPEALERMKVSGYDAVISDLYVPGMDGVQLLNDVGRLYPNTIRFIQAADADKVLVMRGIMGAHQFLPKPCDTATLMMILTRAMALDVWLTNPNLKGLVGRIRTFPSIPSIYMEVLRELNSPDGSTQRVGEIIAKDLAMTTKVMQVLNSAFYALPRKITDLNEAVGILGFETVKSLVLCIQLFSQYDKVKPIFFSIDRLWKHSNAVARSAREIAMLETGETSVADDAFMAGLLHDIGKLVLVSNFDEQYQRAHTVALSTHTPQYQVEQEIFGVGHSDIGAYLLGLWGLPLSMIEAAAWHHSPARCSDKVFSPLTAVHIANAIENEASPDRDVNDSSLLDMPYLTQLGLSERVDEWRELLRGQTSRLELQTRRQMYEPRDRTRKPAKASEPPSAPAPLPTVLPQPVPASTGLPAFAEAPPWYARWEIVGVAAAAAVVILSLLLFMPARSKVEAPSGEAQLPPAVATNVVTASVETNRQGAAEVAAVPQEEIPPPEEAAVLGIFSLHPVPVSLEQPWFGDLFNGQENPDEIVQLAMEEFPPVALQGITFSATNPMAVINGKMVRVNESVHGVRVLSITRDTVDLEFAGQQKHLKMSK